LNDTIFVCGTINVQVLDRNHDRVPRIHDRVEGLKAGEHGRGGVLISKNYRRAACRDFVKDGN